MTDKNVTVLVATTSNVNVSGALLGTIDGIPVGGSDLVLVCHQNIPSENGVYAGGGGRPTTPFNFNAYASFPGLLITVQQGVVNGGTTWQCRIPATGTISTAPLYFQKLLPFLFQGDSSQATASVTTKQLQEHLDSLVVYGTGLPTLYLQSASMDANALTLTNAHNKCLIRCTYDAGNTTITIPKNILITGFVCHVVCMSRNAVSIVGVDASVTVNLPSPYLMNSRYMAVTVTKASSSANTFDVTPLVASGGNAALLAPGTYLITGDGIKLHPAASLLGSGPATTFLKADQDLIGRADRNDPTGGSNPAMLTISARTPGPSLSAAQFQWQPDIENITFLGDNISRQVPVSGCVLEVGGLDPYYPGSSDDYRAGAANFRDCGFYGFSSYGVLSKADRQRFYSQYLRCVGNGDDGLRILGNDPVIGQRCGFGLNKGFQFAALGCSGVIMSGVNLFSGGVDNRSDTCLAALFSNVNGASISNCVFNDTLVIRGQSDAENFNNKGISVTGCDFRPNEIFISNGVPAGSASAVYNTFIYVSESRNTTVTGNSFCVERNQYTFASLLGAYSNARVNFSGSATSEPLTQNYASVPIVADASSRVAHDIADLFTGARYLGFLGGGNVSAPTVYPVMRGIAPNTAPIEGYVAQDAGPLLHDYSREFTDNAALFRSVTAATTTVTVTAAARYCHVNVGVSPTGGILTVILPVTTFHKDIEIVFVGEPVGTLNWQFPPGATLAPGQLPLPGAFRGRGTRLEVALLQRRDLSDGNGIRWYRITTEKARFLVNVTDEITGIQSGGGDRYTFRMPSDFLLMEVRGTLTDPFSAGSMTFDIRKGGTSIFTSTGRPSFGAGDSSTLAAGSSGGIFTSGPPFLWVNDDIVTLRITAASTTGTLGRGLKVWFNGYVP